MPETKISTAVVGGTGYVSGELLRLLAGHPSFAVRAIVSTSQVGQHVEEAFPHLAGTSVASLPMVSFDELLEAVAEGDVSAIFTATPHGATAPLVDQLLGSAEGASRELRIVDLSADFRFPNALDYERVYGQEHPAKNRIPLFHCSVPEQVEGAPALHAVQPGCFTTAVTLATWPLFRLGAVEPGVFASAVTGSSGSGRSLSVGTHHPERRSDLRAYAPLTHRHEAEMRRLAVLGTGAPDADVAFVPHSGPFVRGIHATVAMRLKQPLPARELVDRVNELVGGGFVHATLTPPRLTEVIGTNRCRLGITTRGTHVVVASVIDNLVKGAAGGAVQWMNRLHGLADTTGLALPGLGWV